MDDLFKLTSSYVKKACEVSSRVFQGSPTSLFIFPDKIERKKKLRYGFEKRGISLLNYMNPTHKRLAPLDHWYLQSITVEPEEQRKGHGSLLLRVMIKRIDNEGFPIYLETHSEKNVLFYQKHRFEIVGNAIIPKIDVPIW